jgi:hypothetical protein
MPPAAQYSRDWNLTSEQSNNFGINITCRLWCGSATISSSQYNSDDMKAITPNNAINITDCDAVVSMETDRLMNGM